MIYHINSTILNGYRYLTWPHHLLSYHQKKTSTTRVRLSADSCSPQPEFGSRDFIPKKLDHPAVPTFVPAHSSPCEYDLKKRLSPHTNEEEEQQQQQQKKKQQQQQHPQTQTQPQNTTQQAQRISSPRCYHHYDHHYPPVEVSLLLGAVRPCGDRDAQKPNG